MMEWAVVKSVAKRAVAARKKAEVASEFRVRRYIQCRSSGYGGTFNVEVQGTAVHSNDNVKVQGTAVHSMSKFRVRRYIQCRSSGYGGTFNVEVPGAVQSAAYGSHLLCSAASSFSGLACLRLLVA